MKVIRSGKKIVVLALLLAATQAKAQKFGYIDSEYITQRLPEYKTTIAEIEKWTQRWTKEIGDRYTEIDKLERDFRAEEPLLTDAMKKERQRVIAEKDAQLREYQTKVFGYNGQNYQKQKELMKPLLDQVFKAVEKVAYQQKLRMLFDKASEGMSIIYSDPKDDYSDFVLEELGIEPEPDPTKEEKKEDKKSETTKTNNKSTPPKKQ